MLEKSNVTVAILQPSYLPWLGYLDQMMRSDHFVLLDNVPFDKNGWRNRNRILLAGNVHWLTVPVHQSGRFGQLLSDVEVVTGRWPKAHIETIRQAYSRMPGLSEVLEVIEPVVMGDHSGLVDLNSALLKAVVARLGLGCQIHLASSFAVSGADRNERLMEIAQALGASTYLTGAAAADYLDSARFEVAGIAVEWQTFIPFPYPQRSPNFVPRLSFVDAVCSVGFSGVLSLLEASRPHRA